MIFRRRTYEERIAGAVAKMLERDCKAGEDFKLEIESWMVGGRYVGNVDPTSIEINIKARIYRRPEPPPGEPLVLTSDMVEHIARRQGG